jgi:hypothetical protein
MFNFIDQTGGSQVACVAATLSNGITTQTSSVAIVTGAATVGLIVLGGIGAFVGPPSISAGPHVLTATKGAVGGDGASHAAPPSQPIPHTPATPISSPAPTASPTSWLPPVAAPVGSTVSAGSGIGAIRHSTGVSQGALSAGHPSTRQGFPSQLNAGVVNLTSVGEVVGITTLGTSSMGAAGLASGPAAPHAPTATQAQHKAQAVAMVLLEDEWTQ